MKKILILLIIGCIFLTPITTKAQLDLSQPIIIQNEKQLEELKVELTKKLIELIQQLILALQNQSQQQIQQIITPQPQTINNEVIIPQAINTQEQTEELEPLEFIKTPKLIFKKGKLSKISWETNRPTTLVTSPVFPDDTGWTTSNGAWESCGRMNVSIEIDSECKIVVKDKDDNRIEYILHVFKDKEEE